MSGKIVIQKLPGETIAGRFEGERLESLFVARDDQPTLARALVMGRVDAIEKDKNWAFVSIGLPIFGFLPLSEAPRGLSMGQYLPLVVTREASDGKGPRLSANLSQEQKNHLPSDLPKKTGVLWLAEDLTAWLSRQPEGLPVTEAFTDPLALELESAISDLLQAVAPIPGGGHLLVEPVRTLTAIDVNSGTADPMTTNRQAVPEILRQIELRNLGGRIVIDFIPLGDPERRLELEEQLRAGVKDRPMKIGKVLPSGLCEITRQRVGPALHELLCSRVGWGGCGWNFSPETQIYKAMRAALRLPAPTRVVVTARRHILGAFATAYPARSFVEERLGVKVESRAQDDPALFDWRVTTE